MQFVLDPDLVETGVVFFGEWEMNLYVGTNVSPHRGDPRVVKIERVLLAVGRVHVNRKWAAWKMEGDLLCLDEAMLQALCVQPTERLEEANAHLPHLVKQAMALMAETRMQSPAPLSIHRLLSELQPLLAA